MKKELILSGPLALFSLCSLLALHAFSGFGGSLYSYAVDACLAVWLLAFGEQMLLTCLVFLFQVAHKLNVFINASKRSVPGLNTDAQAITHPAKTPKKGFTLNPLLMAILLIIAGTLSPSDGVDSGRSLPAFELLSRALTILGIGVGSFLVYMLVHRDQQTGDQLLPPPGKTESAATYPGACVSEEINQ